MRDERDGCSRYSHEAGGDIIANAGTSHRSMVADPIEGSRRIRGPVRVLPAFPRGDNAEADLRIDRDHAKPGAPEKILNLIRRIKAGVRIRRISPRQCPARPYSPSPG
jgi:hypothetical protein